MRDISDIFAELRQHPDFITCVIWCKEDIKNHIEYLEEDGVTVDKTVDEIISLLRMEGWEDVATEDGWDVISTAINPHTIDAPDND
jgi:hypothetical protein